MKKIFLIPLAIMMFMSATPAWATNIGNEPANYPGSQQAQITQAPNNLVALVGSQAKVTAISHNQVTITNLRDPAKSATVSVNNAAMFKVGQAVSVTQRLLTPLQRSGSSSVR
jgi:hypothetical protein